MSVNFVTGAAGFIDSHLVEALLKQGKQVIGVDQFNNYYNSAFKRKNIAHFEHYPAFN